MPTYNQLCKKNEKKKKLNKTPALENALKKKEFVQN
jgi:hypothetical protein